MSTAVASPAVSSPVVKTVVSSSTVQGATAKPQPSITKEQVLKMFTDGDIDLADVNAALAEIDQKLVKTDILKLLTSGKITIEQASSMLTDNGGRKLYCKVSEKGGCSVYGLQRMPVTLYADQWRKLVAFIPELEKFLGENAKSLKTKE